MRFKFFGYAIALTIVAASVSQAAVIAKFRLVEANKTTNTLVYPDPFDVWALDVTNNDTGPVDAFEFHLTGTNFIQAGNSSNQPNPVNPIVFGFEAPDTFFVTRPSINAADVLIAPGTLVDTATNFDVAYTVAGGPSLLDVGETRAAVIINVPKDTTLGQANFGSALAAIGGELKSITYDAGGGGEQNPPVITPLVQDVTLPGVITDLQLTATDQSGPIVWSALTYAGGPGKNPAFPGAADATLGPDGKFNWNPNGWRQGVHTFNAIATDSANPANSTASSLVLTVNLTVPEPATLSMLGLALVGCVGVIRRRG